MREQIASIVAPFLEGGREFDCCPPDRIALRKWSREGMCGFNDATQSDALELADAILPLMEKVAQAAIDASAEEAAELTAEVQRGHDYGECASNRIRALSPKAIIERMK